MLISISDTKKVNRWKLFYSNQVNQAQQQQLTPCDHRCEPSPTTAAHYLWPQMWTKPNSSSLLVTTDVNQAQQQQLTPCDHRCEHRLFLDYSFLHTPLSPQPLLATKYLRQTPDLTLMWLNRVPETQYLFRGSNFESFEEVRKTSTKVQSSSQVPPELPKSAALRPRQTQRKAAYRAPVR
jgi:hypothetical protein